MVIYHKQDWRQDGNFIHLVTASDFYFLFQDKDL